MLRMCREQHWAQQHAACFQVVGFSIEIGFQKLFLTIILLNSKLCDGSQSICLFLVNKFVKLNLSTRNWLWQQINNSEAGIIQVLNHSSVAHTEEIYNNIIYINI